MLDFTRTRYSAVEVNPLTKAQLKWSEFSKVPVAVFGSDGRAMNESSRIVEALLDRLHHAPMAVDKAAFSSAGAKQWSDWSVDELAVYMYPNMTRSWSECTTTLQYCEGAKGFSSMDKFLIRNVGAFGMSMAHGKIKQKYGIEDERTELFEKVDAWTAELAASDGPFRSGTDVPDMADVSVYGVLRAAAGLPLYAEIAQRGGAGVQAWLEAMDEATSHPAV